MDNPLITVIVPVYNVAKYLPVCLDSILAQTYKNLEILLIDDGSTDNSLEVCEQYAKKDKRIKIEKLFKNQGLSVVRNTGVKKSTGEYLAFIDSDDAIRANFIERLYTAVSSVNADVAICDLERVRGDLTYSSTPLTPNRDHALQVMSGEDATIRLLTTQTDYYIIACNKLYKKTAFTKDNIIYPVGQLHEDSLTTYRIIAHADTVVCLPDKLYLYRTRPGSIMDEVHSLDRLNTKERAARQAIKYLDFNPKLEQAARVSLLLAYFSYLDAALRQEIPDNYIKKSIEWLKLHAADFDGNPYIPKKPKAYLKMVTTGKGNLYKLFRKVTK